MSHAPTARQRIQHAPPLAASLALVGLLLGGCASDNPMQDALRESLGSRFGGPSEQGFQSLVREHCGEQLVGGQRVATLLDRDTTFRQLTARLYSGDISNDGFTNQLLQEYPAPDANIPVTGCVVNQLNACLTSRCDGRPAPSADDIASREIDATREQNLQEFSATDLDAIDAMAGDASTLSTDDVGMLPSQDPSGLTPDRVPEAVSDIPEPDRP